MARGTPRRQERSERRLPGASAPPPAALFRADYRGSQVQFVPGLVEDVLSLCLSHHDELRRNAVHVLHSMIVSEVSRGLLFSLEELSC